MNVSGPESWSSSKFCMYLIYDSTVDQTDKDKEEQEGQDPPDAAHIGKVRTES